MLSKKELLLFHCLMNSGTTVVSRTELCEYLWRESPTNSHLSQLSLLIQKVKMKLQASGIDYIQIDTVWGQGYKVHSALDGRRLISMG